MVALRVTLLLAAATTLGCASSVAPEYDGSVDAEATIADTGLAPGVVPCSACVSDPYGRCQRLAEVPLDGSFCCTGPVMTGSSCADCGDGPPCPQGYVCSWRCTPAADISRWSGNALCFVATDNWMHDGNLCQ